MFGTLGLPEILFILVLALLVFGPKKLPEVGRTIGRALGEFRRATGDLKRSFDQEIGSLEVEPVEPMADQSSVVARTTSDSDAAAGDSKPDVESDDTRDTDEP